MISFEVLDQSKTAKKSNKTKNPNVQKIANHQPLSELFGLVAVTNAEKVILDRIQESQGQINLFEESDDEKDRQANELRNLIGKLPSLSIFIDEVHHAVSDEIKLRAVATRWAENDTVNSVIGFSGTPYLEKAEKITVVDNLSVATAEITNIVYYYPLINGVGNFLKRPVVKIAEFADSSRIIEAGVREFFETYKDTSMPMAQSQSWASTAEPSKSWKNLFTRLSQKSPRNAALAATPFSSSTRAISSIPSLPTARCSLIHWIKQFLKSALFCWFKSARRAGTAAA